MYYLLYFTCYNLHYKMFRWISYFRMSRFHIDSQCFAFDQNISLPLKFYQNVSLWGLTQYISESCFEAVFDVIYEDLIVTLLTLHVLSWFESVVRFSKPRYIYYNHCSIQLGGGGVVGGVRGILFTLGPQRVQSHFWSLSLTLIFVWGDFCTKMSVKN